MQLETHDDLIVFEPVGLEFSPERFTNVFALKNNKSARETLLHPRYKRLAAVIEDRYSRELDQGLGSFLLDLKQQGIATYKAFLNKYGDSNYCAFRLASDAPSARRGIYAYSVNGKLRYIGRCRDSFGKRVNQGYGRIFPKNCYLDGQATNCHLNSLVAQHAPADVTFDVSVMDDPAEIERVERVLIARYQPDWNISMKARIEI